MKKSVLCAVSALMSLMALNCAWAGSFADACPDLPSCAKAVGKLLGQNYVFDADFKGRVEATPDLQLTRENAEVLFTNALAMEGYTRVPLIGGKTFQIMRLRDARDTAIPMVQADSRAAPELPNTWDLYTMEYKSSHPESVEAIARMARSFMPANARIISAEWSGMLLVTDSAPNLKKLYQFVKANDVKPSPEVKRKWEDAEKYWEKRHLIEAASGQKDEAPAQKPAPHGPQQGS